MPSMSMRPAIGRSRPIKYRSNVLLPLPDPPRIAKVDPRSTWNVTCSMSTCDPQPIRRSLTVMCGLTDSILDAYQRIEECEQSVEHNHTEDGEYHGCCSTGAHSGSTS